MRMSRLRSKRFKADLALRQRAGAFGWLGAWRQHAPCGSQWAQNRRSHQASCWNSSYTPRSGSSAKKLGEYEEPHVCCCLGTILALFKQHAAHFPKRAPSLQSYPDGLLPSRISEFLAPWSILIGAGGGGGGRESFTWETPHSIQVLPNKKRHRQAGGKKTRSSTTR